MAYGLFTFVLAREVVQGALSVGSIFLYYSYFAQFLGALGEGSNLSAQVWEHLVNFGRIAQLFGTNRDSCYSKVPIPSNWRELRLQSVAFAYPESESGRGIADLSLVIPRGSKLGIVGTSGSGKSTLAKLLIGVYQTTAGKYSIDSLEVSSLAPRELHRKMAIVLQESELFEMSLRDNITLLRDVSPEVLEQALGVAHLAPVISALPSGLDTLIGEKGYRLSGGERQRVALARALCRKPEILVLDEATSALDPETEGIIMSRLLAVFSDLTVVAIAHRHHTLRFCDNVIVLVDGRVSRSGSYHDIFSYLNEERSV